MKRKEFMERLEILLYDVQEDERAEALCFYNDYFDDAGEENEDEVIRELESPEKVVAMIKTGLLEKENISGEYSERGYKDQRFESSYPLDSKIDEEKNGERQYGRGDKGKLILIILLGIFISPLVFTVAGSILGGLATVILTAAGIILGSAILAFVLLLTGCILFGIGIVSIFTEPFLGILLIGGGFFIFGMGLFFLWLTAWIFGVAVPKCTAVLRKGLGNLWNRRKTA